MKWIRRISLFLSTLTIGAAAGLVARPSGLNNCVVDLGNRTWPEERIHAQSPADIEVMCAGMITGTDGQPILRFVIYNGLPQTITYEAKTPKFPFADLTRDGRRLRQLIGCASGLKTYYIPPGRSAEVHVDPRIYLERPRRSDRVTVGFYVRSEDDGTNTRVESTPFLLPEEFRAAIKPGGYFTPTSQVQSRILFSR